MCRLEEQKHTEQGWLSATLVNVPLTRLSSPLSCSLASSLSVSLLAFVLALVNMIAIEPASCQSVQFAQAKTTNTKARKTAQRDRARYRWRSSKATSGPSSTAIATATATASMSNHSDPKFKALTPHIDQTLGQKADAEVTSVLKYGARKHAEGNYEEAEAAFRHVLSRDPSNVDAFYDLGALAERKGDLIAALSSYRAALALKPHDKEIAEAVSSIEKTLRNRPAFSFRENRQFPSLAGDSSAIYDGAPFLSSPVLNSPVLPGTTVDQPPLVSPQGPTLSVDSADIAPATFQLRACQEISSTNLAYTLRVT